MAQIPKIAQSGHTGSNFVIILTLGMPFAFYTFSLLVILVLIINGSMFK